MRFVRKNKLVLSGTFTSNSDPSLLASTGTAVLSYVNTSGTRVSTTISLSVDVATNIWSGTWDSSDAQDGRVDWVVYSTGSVVGADQGQFEVTANIANVI